MSTKNICDICGENTELNNATVSPVFKSIDIEDKYIYNLWHKDFLECEHCGFSIFKGDKCKDKSIVGSHNFVNVNVNPFVKKLDKFNHNYIVKQCLRMGTYYNLIGELYSEAISYLMAWDDVNRFLIYYSEEVSEDNVDTLDKVESQFEKFAKTLFDYGVSRLEILYQKDKSNIDVAILYSYMLLQSDKDDVKTAGLVLNVLAGSHLTAIQRKVVEKLYDKYKLKYQ